MGRSGTTPPVPTAFHKAWIAAQAKAMLVIWSDIAPGHETDYLLWLTREHTAERLCAPGFIAVRVFRAMLGDVRRYFICYELEAVDVVDSPEYLARLNNPTPWSQRMMPLLQNFRRGGGRIRAGEGLGQGGIIAPIPLASKFSDDGKSIPKALLQCDGIAAVTIVEIDQTRTSVPTREKSMRQHDDSLAGAILIEGVTAPAVGAARERLMSLRPGMISPEASAAPLYQLVFALDNTPMKQDDTDSPSGAPRCQG